MGTRDLSTDQSCATPGCLGRREAYLLFCVICLLVGRRAASILPGFLLLAETLHVAS